MILQVMLLLMMSTMVLTIEKNDFSHNFAGHNDADDDEQVHYDKVNLIEFCSFAQAVQLGR